ncbi:MAG: hypothetical protein QOI10_2371 [Solirubrobacterales bacterium]|nr:hypothetical protein [Solirubrobacterales bacterium]
MLVAAVAMVGCGNDSASAPAGVATANVVERDFKINGPQHLDAGPVRFSIDNRGPDAHEFILLRSDGKPLPLRDDGITVDEDAVESRTIATLEPEQPGVHEVDAELTPGRYVMLCNMSGHLLGGMHDQVVVG